jgi:hypothetical protein
MLLKGKGSSVASLSAKIGIGAVAAAGIGFLAAGVATEALRPHEREYDISAGPHAG